MQLAENVVTESGAGSLEDLRVVVDFDLGELVLPLRTLRTLAVGQVFELDRPLPSGVRMRANGQLLGEGDLVEIDGRLGVTLTRLATSAASQP